MSPRNEGDCSKPTVPSLALGHCGLRAIALVPRARIVLLRDPEGRYESIPLMGISHDFSVDAVEIIESYVHRWNQEVTHKEVREHLGVEERSPSGLPRL